MASNNLRIIYQNLSDLTDTTITASSTASASTVTANLTKDTKSLVWRSATSTTTAVKANLVLTFAASSTIGGLIIPFCNLSSIATIRIRGYTGTAPTLGGTVDVPTITAAGTLVFDTGNVVAAPYQVLGLWNWGTLPLGVNAYSYGGGTYGRVWITPVMQLPVTSIVIEIIDTNEDKYIEASRLVLGTYWSPTYNTSYGLSTTMVDLSQHSRSEAGDLVSTRGTRHNSMNFDLTWLKPIDRLEFTRIVRGNGLPKPLLISLFPDNTDDWEKEQTHQIYGKLSQLASVTHPMFDMYSSTITIEEI